MLRLVDRIGLTALGISMGVLMTTTILSAQQPDTVPPGQQDSLSPPAQQDTVLEPQLTNMREVTRTLDEAYPLSLQQRGIGGIARMRLFVNTEGAPDTVSLLASTGLGGLDGAARRTARAARFRPATLGGEPVAVWVDFNVQFEGRDNARRPPSVLPIPNRAELKPSFHSFYPSDLARAQIGTGVSLSFVVDSTGSVIAHEIVDPSCYDTANRAAGALIRSIPFEPSAGSGTDQRWSYATVTFNMDSVRLKLFGDTTARDTTTKVPRDPDRPRREGRAPRLNNRSLVSRALVQRYPPALRDKGIGGSPIVHFQVGEDGRVDYKTVMASSGYCELDLAAIEVARIMRFEPATLDGEPVMVWVEIPIVFSAGGRTPR